MFKILASLIVFTNISQASFHLRPPTQPPRESILACEQRSYNEECEFRHQDRVLRGTCFSPNESLPLACKPYGHDALKHND